MRHAGRCSPSGGSEYLCRLKTQSFASWRRVYRNIRLPSQAFFEFTKVSRGPSASFHCLLPKRVRPQDRRAVGRRRTRRAAAEHAGSCSPGALRLWDVSGRRAGSSSPALLSGPPPPPSASSSLACGRASPSPTVGFLRGYCSGFRAE